MLNRSQKPLSAWGLLLCCSLAGCVDAPAAVDGDGEAPAAVGSKQAAAVSKTTPNNDWPCWRGPDGTGVSRETAWSSEEWPDDGLPLLWKKSIGLGFSSISVADRRAYTMGHTDGIDTVWCFDAADGTELWKHSYPAKLVDNLHEGGPAATPTIDPATHRVYTLSKEGLLLCLDAQTGAVHWSCEFQKQFDLKMPEWGFSGSPLIVGDLLIVDAGCVAALDKRSGDVRWKTSPYRPGYGSATVFEHGGERLIAVLNNDCLLVVRADDGTEVDTFPWETEFATTATTPIVSGDQIFISTGYNKGCALLKLTGGKLEPVYQNKHMRNHMNNSVLVDGFLYGFDGNSHNRRLVNLVCLDFATGETRWKEHALGCGSLMAAGGKLLVLTDDGELIVAPASSKSFQPYPRADVLTGRCWTVPVLSNGRVYCRNAAGDLVCVDVQLPGARNAHE